MRTHFSNQIGRFVIALLVFISPQLLLAHEPVSPHTIYTKVVVRQIFPRNQGYEDRIMNATGASLNINTSSDLGKIFARLNLIAAEVYYSDNNTITADNVIREITNPDGRVKAGVWGLLAVLVMSEVKKNETSREAIALRDWSTQLFRSLKIRTANSILNEYRKWDVDYCQYKADGYKAPAGCGLGSLDQMQLYSKPSPPQDIIVKAGLKTVLANDANTVANLIVIGTTTATVGSAAIALSTVLGLITWESATTGATAAVSIGAAFAGATGAELAVAWASAVAAPLAAAVLVIVVGTTEGIRVVEATKVEPMLKMKLGQAMTEHISLPNVLSEINGRDMFFMAFMEAANKGFKLTPPNVNGEVRFYCQAGYMSKFKISYSEDVNTSVFNIPRYEKKEFTTKDLSVGNEETFAIPASAKDIKVEGWYLAGTWKPLLQQSIATPTYLCYTSYGTIFDAKYKNDCPEIGSMITKPNELTVTQGGAYTAWVYLSYKQNGKVVIAQDQQGLAGGWRKTYQIPKDATQIYLYIRDATGWIGQPWKAVVEKTWPVPPNECIKIYGTTLDPKWNNECK